MGKLSDALRRAEQERRHRRDEPAAVPPSAASADETAASTPTGDNPGAGGAAVAETPPPVSTETSAPPAPPPPRARLKQPARVPVSLTAERPTGRPDRRLICFYNRHNGAAEQFRQMRTNILALERDKSPPCVIAIASTAEGEGKTLTCANLAVALADYVAGPVLALDGDFRQPRLHDLFGISRAPGFSDVLAGSEPLREALQPSCVANLQVLTAGRTVDNPTALLGSERARTVLRELRETFKYVIIDTPPVIALTDATILGAQADGVLLVVRAGKTSREAVTRGLDLMRSAGVNILGTILNGIRQYMPGYIYRRV